MGVNSKTRRKEGSARRVGKEKKILRTRDVSRRASIGMFIPRRWGQGGIGGGEGGVPAAEPFFKGMSHGIYEEIDSCEEIKKQETNGERKSEEEKSLAKRGQSGFVKRRQMGTRLTGLTSRRGGNEKGRRDEDGHIQRTNAKSQKSQESQRQEEREGRKV